MKEEKFLKITDYLNIFRKRIVFILLITFFSTLTTGIVSFFLISPIYSASSSVIVGKDNTDKITESEVTMYQNLIKTYSEIAKSKIVAKNAAKKINSNILIEDLMQSTSVSTESGTQIINITYSSSTAEDATIKANALVECFVQESQRLLPSGRAQIIDLAEIPKAPIKPNKKLNILIGMFLGFMISLGIAFVLDTMDNTIKNESDIEKYLEIPIIGTIPKDNKLESILGQRNNDSNFKEAFRNIRTNLLFSMKNRGVKTLIVCSSSMNEGKTTIATNLAYTMSQTGKNVLVVDCDLRNPCVHRKFNISNEKGLIDVIFQELKAEDCISKILNNFHVLTTGLIPYNPSEILHSKKMNTFIQEMEKEYDYIILDTPPLIAFTDALTLAQEKVGVVLVVSSEQSERELCKKSIQLLSNINATLIGTVLNKVDKRTFIGYNFDCSTYGKEKDISRKSLVWEIVVSELKMHFRNFVAKLHRKGLRPME